MKWKHSRFVTKRLDPATFGNREGFSEFTVVGSFASNQKHFVAHAAMLRDTVELPTNVPVEVWHMGPPLVAGERSRTAPGKVNRAIRAEIVGDIAISSSERNKMKNWIAKLDKQSRPRPPFRQYVIQPHMKWERGENGRKLYQRFSCVGFVIECYLAAGINLIDPKSVPKISEQLLLVAYPDLFRIEHLDPKLQARLGFSGRADLGLTDKGPWTVILPGYLFHSLKRASYKNPRPAALAPKTTAEAFYS